jgi:hypothetical protein
MNGLKPFARLIERTSRASIFFIYYFLPVIVSKPRIRTVNARSASDEAIQSLICSTNGLLRLRSQ